MKAKNLLFIVLFPFMIMADNINDEAHFKDNISDENTAIKVALDLAYENNKSITSGKNADYIPILAEVPSDLFAIVVVTVDGDVFVKGDIDYNFSIQSISKVFLLASIIEVSGQEEVVNKIGINLTGKKFDSIDVIEENHNNLTNPMLNAGAIATTSLVKGLNYDQKLKVILDSLSQFANREIVVDQNVYESEAKNNQRNKSIAFALQSYGKIYADPIETVDLYTKQCASSINTQELATMAATLANGGVNPISGKKIVSPETVAKVLQVMVTFGLYNNSGRWFYDVGLPVKSGVSGGVIAVVPGQFSIAAFSPPLDRYGNSIKAQKSIADIIKNLNISHYIISPVQVDNE